MDHVSIFIAAALMLAALYQIYNIMTAVQVESTLVGYDEGEYFDAGLGHHVSTAAPIYRYTWKGFSRTYRSPFCGAIPFLRRDVHTIYVKENGKIYEMSGVLTCVFIAMVFFFFL